MIRVQSLCFLNESSLESVQTYAADVISRPHFLDKTYNLPLCSIHKFSSVRHITELLALSVDAQDSLPPGHSLPLGKNLKISVERN